VSRAVERNQRAERRTFNESRADTQVILGDVIVDRFLLAPHGPTTCAVLRYVDTDLHEHGPPLEVRGHWFGSIGEDSMQVVVIDDEGKRLRLFELGEDALHETKAPPLPADVVADSVVLSAAVVFLGCHSDEDKKHLRRQKLFSLDLRTAKSNWQPAPMWYDQAGPFNPRKAIDELFVDGDRLLAIDDVVRPRYSLIYAIRERARLELVESVRMQNHTSYESVRAAALGRRWLAVISAGINHGTTTKFVAVLERESLTERRCYRYVMDSMRAVQSRSTGGIVDCTGLAFVGDVLMLAGGEAGLGIVDLREDEPPAGDSDDWGSPPGPEVRYRAVEGLARVDRVLGMRGRDMCVAIELAKQGPHRLGIVELSDEAIASW
jgi:hypothetical protein